MVNGPRPTSIKKPNTTPARGTGMLTAAVTPSSNTPTLLPRQTTSMFSVVTSTGTPVLIYGKQATPLAGAWSAEPWSPSEMRNAPAFSEPVSEPPQHLDMIAEYAGDDERMAHFEDYNDNATTERETASVADTTAFVDHRADLELSSPVRAGHAAITESREVHVCHRYRNDPYSVYGQRELYRCFCDGCLSTAVIGRDSLLTGEFQDDMYLATTESYAPTAPFMSGEADGEAVLPPMHSYDDASESAAAQDTDLYWGPSRAQDAPSSTFMPPPPPPRIARRVMRESAETTLDVDVAFYHIAMRWYNKVAQVQERFVGKDDLCPEPGKASESFDDWADAVGRWWLTNFEHRQVKPATASAGLLRSSYTAARARQVPFATHANTSATSMRHPALRQEPRRQFGSSGLTEELLTRHNRAAGAAGALPTPRSLEQRRRDDLPW